MDSSLVVVESPTKAKTISKILGKDFTIVPSMGHILDLPAKNLGVDIEHGFEPEYEVIPTRKAIVSNLKKEVKDKTVVYVATDPDREGEAIGWQIKDKIAKDKKVLRVVFHEITPSAVQEAFKAPREFDQNMIEAQAGRRILDRIVGYFLSPLLWRKIGRGLSAGRVQSVALRLVVDREREIQKFKPDEYWEIEAQLCPRRGRKSEVFSAELEKIEEKKAEIKNKEEAERIIADLKDKEFKVAQIRKNEKKRYPLPPFITSTMQQEAFNKLKFNASRTMIIAQQLYEGIDIGQGNPVGLITYMRTDSTRCAPEAIEEVRNYITRNFGPEYLPPEPNVYKVKKLAQEAHEAIRPALVIMSPASLREFLTPEQYKLYELIYYRFVASQMTPARFMATSVEINAGKYQFSASGSTLIFAGFTSLYNKDAEEDSEDDTVTKKKNTLPELVKEELLEVKRLEPSQHFTKAPPRYSDSSLVKALEENGIGRPSTYAPIVSTLILRDYMRRQKGYFSPTELGSKVCDLLVEYFPKVMDVKFTATLEDELDEIEEGRTKRNKVLEDFYLPFKETLDFAQNNIKKEVITTDEVCEKCGRPMIVKWGRRGKFLSCSGFPACKHSKSISSGVRCPEQGCGGQLIERRSKRGFFYGCSNYPKCKFTSRTLPEDKSQ